MSVALAPRRILIVDDEPANVHVLADALKGGYDLRFATDGESALALMAAMPVDLVLLDVVMPAMSGYELLRRLKDDNATRHVPVIFVTARDEIADEERGLALGAVDYITKPISPAIVRARVATHIELKLQRDRLEQLASLDGLTGIANRRRFDAELERRWREAQREARAFALLLLDVDHFKQYNDHYGHGPGDDCLRRVATALAHAFGRAGDLVARIGGEEFAVLLPGPLDAEPLRRALDAIWALALPHARTAPGRVTASIGAVEARAESANGAAQLLADADRLLYEAKCGGRNRGVYLGPAGAPTIVTGGDSP
jgi:diguanylate cyclase (GGDEF)-like protein